MFERRIGDRVLVVRVRQELRRFDLFRLQCAALQRERVENRAGNLPRLDRIVDHLRRQTRLRHEQRDMNVVGAEAAMIRDLRA